MTLEFDARLNGSTVQGFNFGNNGVHAVVRSVYETPLSSGYKYFEVYVSSGAVDPSSFLLNAAGLAIVDSATITDTQIALTCGVKSRSTVTRASALPIFEAAGTFDALIGPTVARFIVMAGKAYEGGGYAGIDISATNIDNFIVPPTVRLNLFAQAF